MQPEAQNTPETPLVGVVACGGRSSRMGVDKSLLNYHGIPQYLHELEQLNKLCGLTAVSCRSAQKSLYTGQRVIHDAPEFSGHGPMTALLSIFQHFPEHNVILIGCDYPLLTTADRAQLREATSSGTTPACFFDPDSDCYEPLLAFYPYSCFENLRHFFNSGNNSLQQFLMQNNSRKIFSLDRANLRSFDTYQSFCEFGRKNDSDECLNSETLH